MVEELKGINPELEAEVEISHDGVFWAKEGSSIGPIKEKGLHFVRVSYFGCTTNSTFF